MLGKFLVREPKDEKSALSKNQIEVTCPICGAAQREPRLVVTTFCKKCGEHLRIEKQRAIASSQCNPNPSAVFPAVMDVSAKDPLLAELRKPDAPASPEPLPSQPETQAQEEFKALLPTDGPLQEELPLGLGDMMGFKEAEPAAPSLYTGAQTRTGLRPRPQPQPQVPAPQPLGLAALKKPAYLQRTEISEKAERPKPTGEVQGPMAQSTFQKMKEQGYYRQQYFKEVECGKCQHKFKVGRSAKSTTCPSCSATICMEDFDINLDYSTPIDTRGDVLIRRNGVVKTTEIRCRDLRVQQGQVNASLFCSGDITLKTSGLIEGEVRCNRLVIEKGSEVQFARTIQAAEVEIQAKVIGSIQCTGRVLLTGTGSVQGDVTARSIGIDPGGELDGSMNILRVEPKVEPSAPRQVSASSLVTGCGPAPKSTP